VLIFIISFSVTYYRMYKQAEIKQYAMMKAKDGVPAACHPSSEQTLIQKMKSFFSFGHSDECQKYYEAVMLNPGLEVTPTRVLSEVIADFFLHPIGMLGSAIAEFSKNILGGLPLGVNWMVLSGSGVLIVVIIVAICGGVVRLPWYMGGLELCGRRPQERITAERQRSQVNELVQQPSGSSVLNEAAISNLMQAADSVDTGLIIMNVTGAQKLLSAGSSTVVHRTIIEEVQRSSPEKKFIHYASKQSDQSSSESVTSLSGCCGESQSRSHRAMLEDKTSTVESGCLHQPLRKNPTEELQLKMRPAICMSKDEHVQVQGTEVVKECTKAVQQKVETEESASADKEALSDCRAAGTVDSCKVGESDVEEEGNRRRSSSIDVSDEEIGFVKL